MRKDPGRHAEDRYDLRDGLLRSVDVLMRQQGLSVERIGEMMGASRSTAYRYVRSREIPALDHFSSLLRYLREDPEEFLRRGRRGETSPGLILRSRGAERLADLLNAEEMARVVEAIEGAKRAGLLEILFELAASCAQRGVVARGTSPRHQ